MVVVWFFVVILQLFLVVYRLLVVVLCLFIFILHFFVEHLRLWWMFCVPVVVYVFLYSFCACFASLCSGLVSPSGCLATLCGRV